jgi:hypothetical protein
MAPFQQVKVVKNNRNPRGPMPPVPKPAVGRLKSLVATPATSDGTPPATAPICPANIYTQPVFSQVNLQQPPIPVAAPTLPSVTNVLNQVVNIVNQYFTTPLFAPGNGYNPLFPLQPPSDLPPLPIPPFPPFPAAPGIPPLQVGNGSGPLLVLGNSHPATKNAAAANSGSITMQKENFQEVDRQTEDVRVENPDDSDQYVIVKRINSLTMRDVKTGSLWRWSRTSGANSA